jgi:3'(2'), 5'-bisphosphate nucleotidase
MQNNPMLALAVALATRAGEAILAVRAAGFETFTKADQSPVTAADRAAEAIIVAGLRAAYPDIPVVAEEEAAEGAAIAAAEVFWLVDPLDGTREFTAGNDDFTVNNGLIRNGRPVLGVVGAPALNEMFFGVAGAGAWKRSAAGERQIRVRMPPQDGLTVMASRSHGSAPALEAFLSGQKISSVLHIGSSLKFCRVAEGQVDLYPRLGRTMEWDTAAAQAVAEAAGGRVTCLDGLPLRYGKPGFENPHFVCVGGLPSP